MLDLARFVEDCRAAVAGDPTHKTVTEVIKKAFEGPAGVLAAVGEPTASGLVPIYASSTLTIVNVIWKPNMAVTPHNHRMWAVIGIYGGREDNIFWRRIPNDPSGRIEARGATALSTGDVTSLGVNVIHSVTNPISKLTGAIHVYGGDFFAAERSEWDAEHLTEGPLDIAKTKALFGA
jgi:predicted metal-dependent enzyme (double-stranded beta helix superfamily)